MKKKEKKFETHGCDFSFRHYQEILSLLKKGGYKFCFFQEKPDQKIKKVYLRHDVDFSLEKALQLARIEEKEGVYSTFFIRLSAPFYNIFDPTFNKIIKEIKSLGHQIGLHYEGTLDGGSVKEKEIEKDIQILQNRFNAERVISFHRPSMFVLGKRFKKFVSAYQPEFFYKIKFLSDSKGIWKEGCICKWLNRLSLPENMQILIHPIWWGKKEKDVNLHLQQWLKGKFKYLDDSLAKDSKPYKKKIWKTLRF